MDDVIYRQDAVNELREYITEPSISDDESEIIGYNDGIELAISVLSTMPSAQKKGHWIDEETNYLCSECHRGCWVNSDYCPWCGADMRGEENADI